MGLIGAIWGIGGVMLLVGMGAYRLSLPGIQSLSYSLEWYHWVVLLLNSVVAIGLKGYRGFYKGLAPRVAARARCLSEDPTLLRVILAPLFCMGYFHCEAKKQRVTYMMTVGMIVLIVLVRQLGQPWRGLIDLSISAGLLIGFMSILGFGAQALSAKTFAYSPQLPAG